MAYIQFSPGPNTVVLHIGPHKTGTTAIQRTLLENETELRSHGMNYPQIGFNYYGHHRLASALERPDVEALAKIKSQLGELRDQTVILSSENFSRSTRPAVKRLAELLGGFREVVVVCYLRSFLELLYPWWQELVKHREADDINSFLVNCFVRPFRTHLLDAAGMLEIFADAFGSSMSVYLYDRVMNEHGDVAQHFMRDVLGIGTYKRLSNVVGINSSLDPAGAEIVRCLNLSGAYGINVLQRNPTAKALLGETRRSAAPYIRALALSYGQYLPRQMERNLIRALRKLNLWQPMGEGAVAGEGDEIIFAKRDHEIRYLHPSIWLLEPELWAQMRQILKDVGNNRSAYTHSA